MPSQTAARAACRLGALGARTTLVGVLLSGPLSVLLVESTHPQPPWQGPELFAMSFHPVQILPYAGGLVLVVGLLCLLSSLSSLSRDTERPRATLALIACAVFAAMIFFNYVVQTSFVPTLARSYADADAGVLSALSMANPKSLAWAVEMWGWAFLGASTWLLSPIFRGDGAERWARRTFFANGPFSLAGALGTLVAPGWVSSLLGLVLFALWNVLIGVMAVLAWIAFERRLSSDAPA